MTVWMAITTDELELPIVVADTQRELARMLGIRDSTIRKLMKYYEKGENKNKAKKCPYIRVEI